MPSILSPHLLAIVSGATLVVGLVLIYYGRETLKGLRIPDREDDTEAHERADRILKRSMAMLRVGDVIAVLGGILVIVSMLIYAGVIPGA